jgi:hypothetical protein
MGHYIITESECQEPGPHWRHDAPYVFACQVGWVRPYDRLDWRPVSCGRWSCATCGVTRARRWRDALRRRLEGYEFPRLKFVTLTLDGDVSDIEAARQRVALAWSRLSQLLRRQYDRGWYVWVREISPIGRLHVHVLVDVNYVPQRVLSGLAAKCGFGPVCDIRAVQGARRVTRYLAKYLFKAAGVALPRYWRRVQSNCAMLARRAKTTDWMFAASRRCNTFYKIFYGGTNATLRSNGMDSDRRRVSEGMGICGPCGAEEAAPRAVQYALFASST